MPNLEAFYESFPGIPVVIDKTLELVTFKNDGIDAAIRATDGDDRFDGLDSVLLFQMQIYAVASPAYIAEHGMLESLAEPGKHRLIDGNYNLKGGASHTKGRISYQAIKPIPQPSTNPSLTSIRL